MFVLKTHYILLFGSLSGIIQFVPIFAREYTVATAESVGILYCILPFVVLIIKPLFCSIADRNNSHKNVLIVSIILTILGYGLLVTSIFINFGSFSWYWFCILVLIANSGQGVVISLTDYLVMKKVSETNRSFGSFRVYGTIGWGAIGLIAGVINDNVKQMPYLLPGLLLFIIVELIDLIFIYFKLKNFDENNCCDKIGSKTITTDNKFSISKKICAIFTTFQEISVIFHNNPSLIQFAIICITMGCLTGFQWTFQFWYIEAIRGSDALLMGLIFFVHTFIGEIPIFIISTRILRFCGHSMTLNISLLAFALRYFLYGFVLKEGTAYWDILLIETLNGLTFSLFYTVMTDLAQYYADQKITAKTSVKNEDEVSVESSKLHINQNLSEEYSESKIYATMQGIMSGSFEGLGVGIGALIGGYVIERSGVFEIWVYGGYIAVGGIIFNTTIEVIKKIYSNKFN